ncbi:prepilin-type N-terminal cleavage/methylation domain-containing protein [Demequina sp. SO4-13]|uniref:prepilin-type N-terminal cleavage/methylation domain-containing protein n=1 Tax=Demequina sp. SO4-13 TaxID=3401027 RepID=UPI003AF7F9A1
MQGQRDDAGFGLTEIMISMLVLAVLLLAILSLLIRAVETVAANATRATATELATERIEQARSAAVTGDCAVMASVVEPASSTTDGRGVSLQVTGDLENCAQSGDPHEQPRLARVTVEVTTTQPGYPDPVVEIASDVFVKFEP